MNKITLTLLTLLLVPFAQSSFAEDDVTAGARIYNENCSRCHNEDGSSIPATIS